MFTGYVVMCLLLQAGPTCQTFRDPRDFKSKQECHRDLDRTFQRVWPSIKEKTNALEVTRPQSWCLPKKRDA